MLLPGESNYVTCMLLKIPDRTLRRMVELTCAVAVHHVQRHFLSIRRGLTFVYDVFKNGWYTSCVEILIWFGSETLFEILETPDLFYIPKIWSKNALFTWALLIANNLSIVFDFIKIYTDLSLKLKFYYF